MSKITHVGNLLRDIASRAIFDQNHARATNHWRRFSYLLSKATSYEGSPNFSQKYGILGQPNTHESSTRVGYLLDIILNTPTCKIPTGGVFLCVGSGEKPFPIAGNLFSVLSLQLTNVPPKDPYPFVGGHSQRPSINETKLNHKGIPYNIQMFWDVRQMINDTAVKHSPLPNNLTIP